MSGSIFQYIIDQVFIWWQIKRFIIIIIIIIMCVQLYFIFYLQNLPTHYMHVPHFTKTVSSITMR